MSVRLPPTQPNIPTVPLEAVLWRRTRPQPMRRVGHVDLPGKHQDGNVRMRALDLVGYRFSIHLRHAVVQDHKVNGMPFEETQPDPAAAGVITS